jgi:hypothetical protein
MNAMIRYLKQYRFHFSLIGLLAFLLQELPYLPWLLWPPADNPLANNPAANPVLGAMEGIGGVLTIALLILIVRKDAGKPNLKHRFFMVAACLLVLYYSCWIAYFSGVTSAWLIVLGLSVPVPLYYLCISMWRRNVFAVFTSLIFFVGHTASNAINYSQLI